MSTAAVEGQIINRARVQVPAWGAWWADIDIPTDITLTGQVTITLADLSLVGTVVSGGSFEGRSAYHLVGGAGGWGKTVDAKSYANDLGVSITTIMNDIQSASGETVEGVTAGSRVGPHFVRTKGPASRVLHDLTPQAWYVDFAGVTQLGSRATSVYEGTRPRTRVDSAAQVIDIATDELATLVPGVTIDGSDPATDVEYNLTPKRLTASVYASSVGSASRRVSALAKLVDALDPVKKYRGTFEYRVVSQSGERLNLQIVRAATQLPDILNVPVRPGMAGLRADVTPGSLVLVTFIDADPSRPAVIAHDDPANPGWMPATLELGGPVTLGVARVTDAVQAGAFSGVITAASARVKATI